MVDLPQDFIGIGVEPNFAEMLAYLFSQAGVGGVVLTVTSGSTITVAANVGLIILNKASPGTVTLVLGKVANRTVSTLKIVDWRGTQSLISATPNGSETIMNVAGTTVLGGSTGAGVGNGFTMSLTPVVSLSGWIT